MLPRDAEGWRANVACMSVIIYNGAVRVFLSSLPVSVTNYYIIIVHYRVYWSFETNAFSSVLSSERRALRSMQHKQVKQRSPWQTCGLYS